MPHAWWFWKLSLLPALPLNLGLTLAIHVLSNDGAVKHKVYDDWLEEAGAQRGGGRWR